MKHTQNSRHTSNFLERSLNGYILFFQGILWFFAAIIIIAASGFLIVYPLWYFASEYKNLYSIFALCVLLSGALYILIRKLKHGIRSAGGFIPYFNIYGYFGFVNIHAQIRKPVKYITAEFGRYLHRGHGKPFIASL